MSKYSYYLTSILTVVRAFKRPWQIIGIFLGFPGSLPAEVELRGTGWRFAVRSKLDVWVIKETCIDQDYLRGIEIDPSWSIVDIGAGLGDFTVLAASACPDGLVHAYEPHSQSFDLLKHNLTLNQIDRVACYNEAAGVAAQRLRPEHEGGDAVSTSFVKASGKTSGRRLEDDWEIVSAIGGFESDSGPPAGGKMRSDEDRLRRMRVRIIDEG